MADAAESLLAAEVEPFPLTADLVHMLFQLRLPTVSYIPVGLELQVRDAWIAEVQAVTQHPRDETKWVRLLLFCIAFSAPFDPFAQASGVRVVVNLVSVVRSATFFESGTPLTASFAS